MHFEDYKGFSISISPSGFFVGENEDKERIGQESLSELKKKIDANFSKVVKRTLALNVVGILERADSGVKEVFATTCRGINRTSRNLLFTEDVELSNIMADTQANRQRLQTLLDCERAHNVALKYVRERHIGVGLGYGRIEAHQYNEVVEQLIENHKGSCKA